MAESKSSPKKLFNLALNKARHEVQSSSITVGINKRRKIFRGGGGREKREERGGDNSKNTETFSP